MDKSRIDLRMFAPFSVEDGCASGAKGIAPDAGHARSDPDWQPL